MGLGDAGSGVDEEDAAVVRGPALREIPERSIAAKGRDRYSREMADTGAPEGDPGTAPKPAAFVEGWGIGKPDIIYETKPFEIPAAGTIKYQ